MDENVTAPAPEGQKRTNKDRLKEITDSIEVGIRELFACDRFKDYLRTMGKFHRYSFNNTMLIHMQRPDATRVASFNKWKNDFHRTVKKGEHGIKIIAPTFFKKKVEEMKLDPDTKVPIVDRNGEVVMEEKEVKIPMYKVVTVFDVSQTYGEPLPQLASDLTGDVQQFDIFMEALKRSAPVPMEIKPIAPNMDGYFSSKEQRIAIREGMSEVQTICAAVHEIAHSKLHNRQAISEEEFDAVELFDKPALFSNGRIDRSKLPDGLYAYDLRGSDYDPGDPIAVEERVVVNHAGSVILGEPLALGEDGRLMLNDDLNFGSEFGGGSTSIKEFWEQVCPEKAHKSERTQEVEAESIAYAVCAYYGIETGKNSFGYIASWSSDHDLKELKASLETINKTASGLISDIDRNFDLICKERGIDRSAKESEPRAHEALFLLDDSVYLHVQRRSEDIDYDYTLYAADTLKLMDGGVTSLQEDSTLIDAPLIVVADELLNNLGIHASSMTPVDLNKLHEIEAANLAPLPEKVIPDPLRPLDTYPMPNNELGMEVFTDMGYTENDILPISRAQAHELMDKDFSVFFVSYTLEPQMCFDHQDIDNIPALNDTGFGILREEWEDSPTFHEAVEDRLAHQPEREAAFLAHPDSFAIYQLDSSDESKSIRFCGYDELEQKGIAPDRDMYDLIYTAELGGKSLDDIYTQFNMQHPGDYCSPSLSASDIIALNQGGAVSYHYVDRFGFKELPDFGANNPLRNAEMSVEDDYNMVDGIINNGEKQPTMGELERQAKSGQPISLMDLSDAVHREKSAEARTDTMAKRPSVLAMLKQPVPTQPQTKNTAPKKSAEMEI